MVFRDRRDAGRRLAERLTEYRGQNALVLALPRGGTVVGREIADALALPLDVFIVRKIGAPGNPGYAIGAIAERGEPLIDEHIVGIYGIPPSYLEQQTAAQQVEIARCRSLYRNGRALPALKGKIIILVDDGIATGVTILAAIRAIRAERPAELIVAVPVAPPPLITQIEPLVDRLICLTTPEPFIAVGRWFEEFAQVPEAAVRTYLEAGREQVLALSASTSGRWPLQPD